VTVWFVQLPATYVDPSPRVALGPADRTVFTTADQAPELSPKMSSLTPKNSRPPLPVVNVAPFPMANPSLFPIRPINDQHAAFWRMELRGQLVPAVS
jgi:hypothetical protein